MRFPSAYYLMLIYLTVMFKPLIPVISDMYSHTFSEAIHLATIHAVYGTHHLEKALATTGESDSKDPKNIKSGETYNVHIGSSACIFNYLSDTIKPVYFLRPFYKLSNIFLSIPVPPPEGH